MYKVLWLKYVLLIVFGSSKYVNGLDEIPVPISQAESNVIFESKYHLSMLRLDGHSVSVWFTEGHFIDEPEITGSTRSTARLKVFPLRNESSINVSAYYIIVELREKLVNKSLFDIGHIDLKQNYTESQRNQEPFYAAAMFLPDDLKESAEFVIGNQETVGFYSNPPLKPDAEYRFGIAAEIEDGRFIYQPSSRTIITNEEISDNHSRIFWMTVLGILFFVILSFIAILLYINSSGSDQWRGLFISWSKPNNRGSIFKDLNGTRSRDRLTLITPNAYENEEEDLPKSRTSFNDLSAFEIRSHPIPVSELSDYVAKMNETCGFKQEFSTVPRGQWAKWDDARLPENKGKNRYGNLLAYDFNRVALSVEKNEENTADEMEIPIDDDYAPTDYINASYIDGYNLKNRYIATQGPLQSTIKDFWKMVWQCDSRHIVMLTNVEELGKMKCDKYWPENVSIFGLIKVKLVKTLTFADYIIRQFSVEKKGFAEREVTQYHFISWPDHTVPTYSTSLISFVKRIREHRFYKNAEKPIIVHCSAGVGRTGTLIMIDAMLEMSSHEKHIDLLAYLCTVRSQRVNMVEKLQQYIFVHQILVEILCKDNTDIECSQLDSYIIRLKYYDPTTKKTLLESQFEALNKLYKNTSKEVCAAALANPTRNRNQEIVPSNSGRVVFGSPEDYINAVYVNGYREKDEFIVTEIPLIDTRNVFWKMVDCLHIKIIVLLSDASSQDIYWPQELHGKQLYNNIEVHFNEEETFDKITIRTLRINNKVVKQFHLRNWNPSSKSAQCSQRFLDFCEKIETYKCEMNASQMVVQCLNGCSASGIFCGASFLCDRIKEEQRVDVFLAASTVRTQRRQFLQELDHFNLLYDIAKCYTARLQTSGALKHIVVET